MEPLLVGERIFHDDLQGVLGELADDVSIDLVAIDPEVKSALIIVDVDFGNESSDSPVRKVEPGTVGKCFVALERWSGLNDDSIVFKVSGLSDGAIDPFDRFLGFVCDTGAVGNAVILALVEW